MSLGVPVIASKTTIHAYYYDESIIQYYDNDDEFQLAEQILRLKNNPELRRRLAENAKRYLEENTWDARKHEYLQLIDSLLNPNLQVALVL
jgi:glycosyltransferase involved in cell wall biosynthesis